MGPKYAYFSLLVGFAGCSSTPITPPPPDAGAEAGPPVCSPEEPDGDCPAGEHCVDGACAPIAECANDDGEPNDTQKRSTTLELDTSLTGNICEGDVDYFRLTIPAGQIVNVLVTTPAPTAGQNLDAYAYRADGSLLGGLWEGTEPHPSFTLKNETNEEGFGFYRPDAEATFFVKVLGRAATHAGPFTIVAHATGWKDGPTCIGEGFTSLECTGGTKGKQTLWMWPYMSPEDTYVSSGYMFSEFSNYRYLRRETMMLVRYAIHEVNRQFPATKALGLADMCQRDGITPGFDVGAQRHPTSSHDQGGNIDVAYYQTGKDNKVRVICDPNGGSQTSDEWYCLDSAVNTHIVDLPRTVYFVVALARSPRFRAAGVDRVIGPLMDAEAQKMKADGTITDAEYSAYSAHVVWGDAWPAHHHHLHLSLQWM